MLHDFGGHSQTPGARLSLFCKEIFDTGRHGQTLMEVKLAETEGFEPSIRFCRITL